MAWHQKLKTYSSPPYLSYLKTDVYFLAARELR